MKRALHKFTTKWKYTCLFGFVVASLAANSAFAGSIVDSLHNFTVRGWATPDAQICVYCHAPHNGANPADGPLWNHEVTAATYTMYASPTGTFDGAGTIAAGPTGASKLCLSCHDGTVALDSFGGATGTNFISGNYLLGTDLSNDHPISFTYDTALATADGGLADPATTTVTIGEGTDTKTGTIAELMLPTGELQCSSCHDVHNKFAIAGQKLLRISLNNSDLCLTCHTK